MKYEDIDDYLTQVTKQDPVPCKGCTACCRGHTSVALRQDLGDDPFNYGLDKLAYEYLHGPLQPPSVVLKRQTNGDCIFLVMGACTVYEKRPAVCRFFDCRRIHLQMSAEDRKQMVEHKVFSQEIMTAADQRVDTVRLIPGEAQIIRKMRRQGIASKLISGSLKE